MRKFLLAATFVAFTNSGHTQPPDRVTIPAQNLVPPKRLTAAQQRALLRAQPSGTLWQFVEALNEENFIIAAECVQGAPENTDLAALRLWFRRNRTRFQLSFDQAEKWPAAAGDHLQTARTFSMRDEMQTRITFTDNINFVRVAGEWKIAPRAAQTLFARTEASTNAQAANRFCEHMATLIAHAPHALSYERAQISMKRQKALMLGVLQFVVDHGELFAFSTENFRVRVAPYLNARNKGEEFLAPPEGQTKARPYSFNANLFNKALGAIKEPARTVAVYDGRNGALDFRFSNHAVVGFVDGHIELVDAERAKTLIWKP